MSGDIPMIHGYEERHGDETADARQALADSIADRYAAMVDGNARAVVRMACVGAALAAYDALASQPAPSGWQQRIAIARRVAAEIEKLLLGAEFGPDDAALWDAPDGVERQTVVRIIAAALLETTGVDEWQRRITAMEPWGRGGNCHFCGVYRQWERDGKWVDATHAPNCLWQNAVDALPPAPEVKESEDVAAPTLADMWPWAVTSSGREYCFFCRAWRDEKRHAYNCIWQAAQRQDPIAAAVRAELQPLEDALIDAGHKLAKEQDRG